MNAIIKDYMQTSQFSNVQASPNLNQKSPSFNQKSPTGQDMKENLSAIKTSQQQLNMTNEDIINDDENYQNELKTPTGPVGN